jgi:phospholipase C
VTQLNAVVQGPHWDSTAIFVTWGDYGGFDDHVPPAAADALGFGPRAPLLVISPYPRPGYASHTTYEFSSLLEFADHRFGLQPLTHPDKLANAPLDAFNICQRPLPPQTAVVAS